MHTQPFDRLVRAADELAALGDEPVLIQRGSSSYMPRFAQHVDYVDESQMRRWLAESRVLVSHCGAGAVLGALQTGKPLVLAPRMARFSEHFDDHQLELAEALAKQGRTVTVTELSASTLAEAIEKAVGLNRGEVGETRLHSALRGWLAEEAAERSPRQWRPFGPKHGRE